LKTLATLVFVSLLGIIPGTAFAERGPLTSPLTTRQLLSIITGGGVTVPPEWEGIWTTTDTVYNCPSSFNNTSTVDDTICTGEALNDPGQTQLVCTGNATATTYDITCTGTDDVIPDCTATYNYHVHGTRTGESYFSVAELNVTYSGTAEGCDLLPPQCVQINTHGTRTGPAPPTFCSTPTRSSTWGQVKIHYR